MVRSALSVLGAADARHEQQQVGRADQLDRVVGGEQRRGVEQDHVETTACRGDHLALRGDDLRRVRSPRSGARW